MSASEISEKEVIPSAEDIFPIPSSHEPTESDILARDVSGTPLDPHFESVSGTPLDPHFESVADDAAHIDDGKPRIVAAMGEIGIGTPLNEAAKGKTDVERAPDEGPRTNAEHSPVPHPPPSSDVDEPSRNGARVLEVGLEANSLDGGNVENPMSVMEKVEPQLESQARPRRGRGAAKTGLELAMVETSPKTPDWLPPGWLMENRIRGSGVTAGMKDRYFYDPVSGRQFRSKKEVFCFLETGSSGRYRDRGNSKKRNADANIMALESSGCDRQNGSSSKGKRSNASSFNFNNRPSKVRWVLTDSAIGLWTPFIGDESLPESSKQEWATLFTSSTLCNGRSGIFS